MLETINTETKDEQEISMDTIKKNRAVLRQELILNSKLGQTKEQIKSLNEVIQKTTLGGATRTGGTILIAAALLIAVGILILLAARGFEKVFGILFATPGIILFVMRKTNVNNREKEITALKKTEADLLKQISELPKISDEDLKLMILHEMKFGEKYQAREIITDVLYIYDNNPGFYPGFYILLKRINALLYQLTKEGKILREEILVKNLTGQANVYYYSLV